MKDNRFYNFTLTVLILIVFKLNFIESVLKTCKIQQLQMFGIQMFCESKVEDPVSCVAPYVTKVYQQCKKDYIEENIPQKIIYCNGDGEWSDEALECSAECTDFPNKLELLDYSQIKFPTSYVEFSRKKPVDGEINKIPGIILAERQILVKNFDYYQGYYLIIHKSGGKSKKYDFYPEMRGLINNNDYIILGPYLDSDFYIKFDADTKPACYRNISSALDVQYSSLTNSMLDPDMCYVPKVDNIKVQMNCIEYQNKKLSTKCLSKVEGLELRCQIGYKNYNLDLSADILSKCTRGQWEVFGEEDDCQLACGLLEEDIQPYSSKLLYKGNSANIINAPWHVGIYANNTDISTFQQICGGSIIDSNVVISAAHCFYDDAYSKLSNPSNYLIGAGKTYRSFEASEVASYIEIKDIHIPIHYQSAPVRNDIAVLILKTHLQYTSRIKPICINWDLNDDYDTSIGIENGEVVGWGATSKNDTSSPELLELNFETLSNYECKKLVTPIFRSEITGDKFCAKNTDGGAACQGDSGGGFIISRYSEGQRRYFLSGVVSLGLDIKKYCSDGFITMFTNIKLYKDFIQQAIAKNKVWLSDLKSSLYE